MTAHRVLSAIGPPRVTVVAGDCPAQPKGDSTVTSAATITVTCPDCGSPATVSLCLANADESEHVLAFTCGCGHQIDEFDALRLWVESHQAPEALEPVETP
jgi:hypothetical protein